MVSNPPRKSTRDNWHASAAALAAWAGARLVNRTDAYGAYRPEHEIGREYQRRDGGTGALGEQRTVKRPLTPAVLARHFRAAGRGDVIGLHAAGADNLAKWGAVDIDHHGPTSTAAGVNRGAALHWYGALVGTYFLSHPAIQRATVHVVDPTGPGMSGLPAEWTRVDEWYNFTANPRPSVHVLATVDESTYDPGPDAMGADHPITWWHDFDGGRSWYTAMGHTTESYSDPRFLSQLLGGILYAAQPAPDVIGASSQLRAMLERARSVLSF